MIAVRLPAAIASRTSGQVRSSTQTLGAWPCAGSATSSSATSKNRRLMIASSVATLRSVQRFHLDDRGAVIASGPERGWSGRAVDIHAAHIGRAWQQIFGDLAGLRIEPRDPVGEHAAGPDLAAIVRHNVVG